MLTITVEDYVNDPAKRRFADEIMERFAINPNNVVEMRFSEGEIEVDWMWLNGYGYEVHTTLLTPTSGA